MVDHIRWLISEWLWSLYDWVYPDKWNPYDDPKVIDLEEWCENHWR